MTTTEKSCPRCGTTAPFTRYDVCAPCTAAEGWDPECSACLADGRGEDSTGCETAPKVPTSRAGFGR